MSLPLADHVIFVFVDGVGLGKPDGDENPLAARQFAGLECYSGEQAWTLTAEPHKDKHHLFLPIDATLGYSGLPQSGTGQATLFTGVDCIGPVGRHFGPFPHSKNKQILSRNNIFQQFLNGSDSPCSVVAFANAYPEIFFEHNRKRKRWTVTTFCCDAAGVRLRTAKDLQAGRALSAGLTRSRWNTVGLHLPEISPTEAAQNFHSLSQDHAFTLFEYFLTDKAGHRQDMTWAISMLDHLSLFLSALHDRINPERDLLILTSDHGNLEDLSTKTHTRNMVPFLAYGAGVEAFADIKTIADVVPALMHTFDP